MSEEADVSGTAIRVQVLDSQRHLGRQAPQYGLTPEEELLLYVIHGALHLVGYEDTSEAARTRMEARQRDYLARLGPRLKQIAASEAGPLQAGRDES